MKKIALKKVVFPFSSYKKTFVLSIISAKEHKMYPRDHNKDI